MARLKVKSNDVEGFRYVVTQLGAVDGRRWVAELGRAVIPAIVDLLDGTAIGAGKKITIESIIDAVSGKNAKAAVQSVFDGMPQDRLDALIDAMAEHTEIYGTGFGDAGAPLSVNFDEHFAGRYKAMFLWLGFALQVNFADFFGGRPGQVVSPSQPSAARA